MGIDARLEPIDFSLEELVVIVSIHMVKDAFFHFKPRLIFL